MSTTQTFDVVVAGAGTSGSAAAYLLAKHGLRVCCLEREPLEAAGTHWAGEMNFRMYDTAGVPRPFGRENLTTSHLTHFVAGWGPTPNIRVLTADRMSIDTRLLGARLRQLAEEAGATFHDRIRIEGTDGESVRTSRGTYRGDWLVDATGLEGDGLFARRPVDAADLCGVAQGAYEITDPKAADQFFEARGMEPGECVCFLGIAGGYSYLKVSANDTHVNVRAGAMGSGSVATAKKLVEEFVRPCHWLGRRVLGGWRPIPVVSPTRPLFNGRVAFLGDAACQVFPAHASGLGSAMMAAKLLADELAAGRGVEGYAAAWHRAYGAEHCAYDLIRRHTQHLTAESIGYLMTGYLIESATLLPAFDQQPAPLTVGRVNLLTTLSHRRPDLRPARRLILSIPRLRFHHKFYLPNRPRYQRWWWSALAELMKE